MAQFNKKSFLVFLLLCVPMAANAACNVYQVDTMEVVPSEITAAGATEVASDFEYQNIYPCASGSWVIYIYHDTTLNVYRRVYSCTACPSGYELVRQIIHVGTCSFNGTVEYPITYSCVSTSDVTEGAVRTSLPSGASNLVTYGGANCDVSSDVPTLYVRVSTDNNYYLGVKQCVACSNSNYRPVLTKFPGSVRGSSLAYVDCQSCGAGTGLKNGSGSDTCSACSAGTYNTGKTSFCLSATPGYFVAKANASSQTACATGAYSAASGSVACTACPSGRTNSGTGNSNCASYCSNSDGVDSWATTTWATTNTVSNLCTPSACKEGRYWNSGSSICDVCPQGTYNDTTSLATECKSCPLASEVYTDESLTNSPGTTTSVTGAVSESQCYIETEGNVFYNNTGRYIYSGIVACNAVGDSYESSTSDGVSCSTVVSGCRGTNGSFSTTYTVKDGELPEWGTTGPYCFCTLNNKVFYAANMNTPETCESACPNYCVNLLTDSDYISQYNLPSQVGCSN